MSFLLALLLGSIQGLTEFFPISSSAHLKLAKMVLGAEATSTLFDLSCHLGTLGALVWFFKEEISQMLAYDRKRILYLILALLPLLPSYFLLRNARAVLLNPRYLGFFLMGTGVILLLGQKLKIKKRGGILRDILLIGTMQSMALIPGISRSASTISCARVLGWSGKDAVRFSFLLAIPTIVGGNLIEMRHLAKIGALKESFNLECLLGLLAAFFVGIGIVRFAMRMLAKGRLSVFAWYCLGLGCLCTFYLLRSL